MSELEWSEFRVGSEFRAGTTNGDSDKTSPSNLLSKSVSTFETGGGGGVETKKTKTTANFKFGTGFFGFFFGFPDFFGFFSFWPILTGLTGSC